MRTLVALFFTLLVSPAFAQPAVREAPLKVVATFSILADWARVVGGEHAEVHSLVGSNSDAHVYEPTPTDVRKLAGADVLIMNGLGFEGWIPRLREAAEFRGRVMVATTGIVPRRIGAKEDPHAWHDLRNARIYVLNITSALAASRPLQAQYFIGRATTYLRNLEVIEADSRRAFDSISRERRVIVTSHDSFGYLGAAFGITIVPAQGLSTASESNAAAIGALIRQIKGKRAHAIFVENIRDSRLVEQIAAESGAVVGGRLYSDALGSASSPASTYLDLYCHNTRALAEALRDSTRQQQR